MTVLVERLPRSLLRGVIIGCAIAWTVWLSYLHLSGLRSPVDLLEEPLTDLRILLSGPTQPPAEVVIVAIDDATVKSEGGYPIDRARMAFLLDRLKAAGAKTLAVDVLFVEPKDADGDRALAEALAAGPTVIAAAGQFTPDESDGTAAPAVTHALQPLTSFSDAAHVGLANVATTDAGTPRHLPLVFTHNGEFVLAFALRAAALQRSEPILALDHVDVGGHSVSLDLRWHLPLRFYGPGGTIRTISAQAFLTDDRPPDLTGVIAVVGVTATAVGDTFGTPFDPVTPGVEVQATGIAELLGGPRLIRSVAVRQADVVLAMLLAVAGTLLILFKPSTQSLVGVGVGILTFLAANMLAFSQGIWTSASLPLVAALPAISVAILHRQIADRRRAVAAEGARDALQRFQPSALAGLIAHDPAFLAKPLEQSVGVVFIDIGGFSGWSETIGSSRTQDFLKAFHTLIVETARPHNGLVLNFMGDGAMIVFGMLDGDDDPASSAYNAAFELLAHTSQFLKDEAREAAGLSARLGLHFGPVILSRLGHEYQQQISVSGNTVNVASRLMEVAKEHGARMAMSRALLEARRASRDASTKSVVIKAVAMRGLHMTVDVALWK